MKTSTRWRDLKDYEKLEWLFSKVYLLVAILLIAITVTIVCFGVFDKRERTILAPEPHLPTNNSLETNETMSNGDYAIFLHIYHQNDELE